MYRQHGNVLFLILIAVALFAALSYAVTQNTRGGSSSNKEQLRLQAGQILQYGAQLQNAMHRMMLINGCTENELSFNADWDGDGLIRNDLSSDQANRASRTDGSCRFFSSNGGDIPFFSNHSFLDGQIGTVSYRLSGNSYVLGLGDDSHAELMFVFRLIENETNKDLCNAYNDILGLSNNIEEGHDRNTISYFSWNGTYGQGATAGGLFIGDVATELYGQPAGCFKSIYYGGGGYEFYYVLLER